MSKKQTGNKQNRSPEAQDPARQVDIANCFAVSLAKLLLTGVCRPSGVPSFLII